MKQNEERKEACVCQSLYAIYFDFVCVFCLGISKWLMEWISFYLAQTDQYLMSKTNVRVCRERER